MRVLIVSCVFPPEPITSSRTSFSLALKLAQSGHIVTVVTTFPSRPSGQLNVGYRRKLFTTQMTPEGFCLIRCWSALSTHSSLFSRFLENITFGIVSAWRIFTLPRADVIYANTWPIFGQGLICFVAHFRKIPVVLSIQDVYPESLMAQNRFDKNSLIIKLLRWLDGIIAWSASDLIVISKKFEEIYRTTRNVPAEQIHILPNWIEDDFEEGWNCSNCRAELGVQENSFVLLYGGNIGVAAGVQTAIQAFGQLKSESFLVIAGAGSNLQECQRESAGNERIKFHTPWQKEDTHKVLATADVFLLPTVGAQSLASVPSKLITYMLAGRPVLAAALPDSELAEIIIKAGCGWVVQPGDIAGMASRMEEASDTPKGSLESMGLAGRHYALDHFTDAYCLPKVIEVLKYAGNYTK